MFILSAAQMRECDRQTMAERGIAGSELMAAAAAAVVGVIERDFKSAMAGRIGILCGAGNNGGDGLVMARMLSERRVPALTLVLAPEEKLHGDAQRAYLALRALAEGDEVKVRFVAGAEAWASARRELLRCDLLVDAVFGTGLLRPVRGWLGDLFADVNAHYGGPVVAVDIPSGLSADGEGGAEEPEAEVLRADATVTFAAPKLGHFLCSQAEAVGKLTIAPIGISEAVIAASGSMTRLTTEEECRLYREPRRRDAHKGMFGHVLVIAGSQGKSGAAVLAGTAALRMGAGLVTVAVPRSIQPIVAGARAELMTEGLPETRAGGICQAGLEPRVFHALMRPATVIALGPGLGQAKETAEMIRFLVAALRVPCVLDADGLNAFAGCRSELKLRAGGVLTPHPGEMARLYGVSVAAVESRRMYYTQRLAAETGAVALLKGRFTLIADPDGKTFLNTSGNPGMATAGMGDVLTGMMAGLLAQFPPRPILETAAVAAYWHGGAGDRAAETRGEMGLVAGDVIEALPTVTRGAQ